MSSELRVDKIVPTDGVPTGGGGGIVQVKQAIHYEYVQYNQNALTAGLLANGSTGNYSITITPKFSTSKILISFNSQYDSYAGQRNYVTFYRSIGGGTASNVLTGSGAGRGLVEIWNNDHRVQSSVYAQYLDSPNTTQTVTYTVYALASTGSFYLGLYNNQKFIHAMEVSA
tara:strand:+ start:999 stop:1511 length:513 start_codon:yes stop_codon:yes gene_type:complete